MDPWARIENIPKNVSEVDLYFYHVYEPYCNITCSLEIRVAPQKVMTDAIWDKSFEVIKTIDFPVEDWKKMPKDKLHKQFISRVSIDRTGKYEGEKLCMHAVLKAHGGGWKSGYIFEAFSIEFGKESQAIGKKSQTKEALEKSKPRRSANPTS